MIKDIRQRFGKITNFNKTNTKNTRLRYVKVELLKIKDKEKMLEAARERKT